MINTDFQEIAYRRDLHNYLINRKGEILSLHTGRVLKPQKDRNGYACCVLTADDGKKVKFIIHIAVAKQYVPNDDPATKIYVNHIDENKFNPSAENLEWVTPKENTNHGTCIKRSADHRKKPVNEYTITGEYVRTWASASDVSNYFINRLGVDVEPKCVINAINNNCRDKQESAFGRIWKLYNGDTHDIYVRRRGKRNHNRIGLEHSRSKLSLCYDSPVQDEYLYHEITKEDIYNYFTHLDKLTDYEKQMFESYRDNTQIRVIRRDKIDLRGRGNETPQDQDFQTQAQSPYGRAVSGEMRTSRATKPQMSGARDIHTSVAEGDRRCTGAEKRLGDRKP